MISNEAASRFSAPCGGGAVRRWDVAVSALVVLGVGLLLSPAVLSARDRARRSACQQQLQNLGLALMNYHDVYISFPPGYVTGRPDDVDSGGNAWGLAVTPFLDEAALFDRAYNGGSPTAFPFFPPREDARVETLYREGVERFRCPDGEAPPQNADRGGWGLSNYSANSGHRPLAAPLPDVLTANWPGQTAVTQFGVAPDAPPRRRPRRLAEYFSGLFFANSKIGYRDLTDGSANTVLLGERGPIGGAGLWGGVRSPATLNDGLTDGSHASRPGTPGGYSSAHSGIPNVLFADGRVAALNLDIDSQPAPDDGSAAGVLQKLSCRNDGQVVSFD